MNCFEQIIKKTRKNQHNLLNYIVEFFSPNLLQYLLFVLSEFKLLIHLFLILQISFIIEIFKEQKADLMIERPKSNLRRATSAQKSSSCFSKINSKLLRNSPPKIHQTIQIYDRNRTLRGHSANPAKKNKFEEQGIKINKNSKIIQVMKTEVQLEKLLSYKLYDINNIEKDILNEENLQLKNKLKHIKGQLGKQKSRMKALKDSRKSQRKIDIQFQKEEYWRGTRNYMICGIKSQYEKMKIKYQQKCQQFQQLKNNIKASNLNELKVYVLALLEENTRLSNIIKKKTNQKINEDKEVKYVEIEQILEEQKLKNRELSKNCSDQNLKMDFLDKLIIEKDNNEHQMRKKFKNTSKKNLELLQKIMQLKKTSNQKQLQQNQNIKFLKQNYENKIKQLQKEQQHEKNLHKIEITKLQSDNDYLRTKLKDNFKFQRKQNQISTINKKKIDQKQKFNLNNIHLNQIEDANLTEENINSQNYLSKSIQMIKYPQQKSQFEVQEIQGYRVQKTADIKWQNGVRKKRIQFDEVIQIGEKIKYRLIAKNLNINSVKKIFDYKISEEIMTVNKQKSKIQNNTRQEDSSIKFKGKEKQEKRKNIWEEQYITMRQVRSIIIKNNHIFGLQENQIQKIIRYFVEETPNSNQLYVYCDENNQNKREVVKSIFKTVISQYQCKNIEEQEKVNSDISDLLDKYGHNLGSMLRATYPSGYISKSKLLQVILSLHIEINESTVQHLIGIILLQSQSLATLKYETLFTL